MAQNTSNGSVPAGARKRQQFRETQLGVLPNSIAAFSRLTIDPSMKTALTTAGAKLAIEIDATGTRVYLAHQRTGEIMGSPEDLSKLGSIRAFVSRERKESAGVEVAKEVSQLAFKAARRLETEDQEYEQRALDASYGASTRPLLTVLGHIAENEKKLEANTNPKHAEVFRPILESFFARIREVYCRYVLAITAGKNVKGFLDENLLKMAVPQWVHAKLTAPGLVLDRSQELFRVLFPSDPSKGLTLTFKEWRSGVLRQNLGHQLLQNSGVVFQLVDSDELVRTLCKLSSDVALDDESNPSVAKLLKCKLAVIPPVDDFGPVIEPASKTRGGWKFPSPSMDSIQGAMASLSTALLRVYSANLQSVDLVGDFYATIAPGCVSRAAVTPTNNFYVQWGNAPDPGGVLLPTIRCVGGGEARVNLWRWLRTEMRLSEKAEGGKSLAKALLLNEDGSPRDNVKRMSYEIVPDDTDPEGKKTKRVEREVWYYPVISSASTKPALLTRPVVGVRDVFRKLTETESSEAKEFQKKIFPSKGKKKAIPPGNSLTKLTPEGQELVDEVAKLSPYLSERIKVWLRSFSDSRLQRAAVKLTNASFDELFIQDAESSDDESGSDEESERGVAV